MDGLILGFQFTFGVIGALAALILFFGFVVACIVIWSGK